MSPQLENILKLISPYQTAATKRENKLINISLFKDILQAFDTAEISMSKVCEIINCLYLDKIQERFIPVSERFPATKDYDNGSSYSDTVWATDGKQVFVMRYAAVVFEDGERQYGWANCYNDIEGDGLFDDDYKIIAWKPINRPDKIIVDVNTKTEPIKNKYLLSYTAFTYAGGSSGNHLGVKYNTVEGSKIVELSDDELTDEHIDNLLNPNQYSNAPRTVMNSIKKI